MSLAAIFNSPAAVAAIGNAINSIADASAVRRMNAMNTDQLRQQIAFEEAIRQRQKELMAQEVARQQIYARGAGDAFSGSLQGFSGFEQRVGDATAKIADIYRQFLNQRTAQQQMIEALAPLATGPAAEREQATRQQERDDAQAQAGRLAAVEGFGKAMGDAWLNMQRNEQLAALLNNFARGSAAAGQAEIDSQAGRFFRRQAVEPAPSRLGDLFVGLSDLYGQYQRKQPPDVADPIGLKLPTAPGLDYMHGAQGVRADRPSGSTGLVLRSNLGIR